MRFGRKLGAAVASVALCLAAQVASADTILVLDDEFSGGQQPEGHLTATFADEVGGVRLTMSAANLVGTEFATEWNFNFDPSLDLNLLTIAHQSGVEALSELKGENAFHLAGGGNYDINFVFDNAPPTVRFKNSSAPSVYLLTYAGAGFSSSSFNFLSDASSNSGSGTFLSEAKVQGVGANAQGSGKIGTTTVIPLPASVWSGFALLGALGGWKLRSRRSV